MAVQNSNYFKLQSNNHSKPNELPIYNDQKKKLIRIREINNNIINNEYFGQLQNQEQQTKPRSISLQDNEKTRFHNELYNPISINQNNSLVSQPNQQFQMEQLQLYTSRWNNKQEYNDSQNIIQINAFNQQNHFLKLGDQIDYALNKQTQNSINKKQQFDNNIIKKQQYNLPTIHQTNHQIQLQNSRPQSIQKTIKNDSLNCTQSSFMKTQRSVCNQCKQDILENKINLSCWHHYHQECLSQIIKYQIELKNKSKLPKCLCGIGIKQQVIKYLPSGQNFIEALMKKQLDLIYKLYSNLLNQCPTCQFRFIYDQRLGKLCYCQNCKKVFKIL